MDIAYTFFVTDASLPIFVLYSGTDYFLPAEDKRQPHILYILVDDLGWNDIGMMTS